MVAALILLAGCLGGDGDPTEPATQPSADAPEANLTAAGQPNATADLASVEAPDLEAGQWFAYEREGGWTMGTDGQVRLVVLEADGSGYRTGMSDREALAVDLFWFNHPMLGPLDAELSPQLPSEGNPPPQVLDWPLEDSKTWESQGYGDEWTFEAHRVDGVDTPAGPYPGYAITANGTLAEAIEATYVPQLEALTSFGIHWSGEGDPEYRLELTDAGTGHDGPAWTGDPLTVLHDRWAAEDMVPPEQGVDVPEATTDLYSVALLWATRGASTASLWDPAGEERFRAVATPGSPASELATVEDPAAGSWTWRMATTGNQACGDAPVGVGCDGVFLRTVSLEIVEAG